MRYVCFLRAVNVGGRNIITMSELKKIFEGMGLENVETFIASGNVIFDSRRKAAVLEKLISATLEQSLGYPVPSFIRTIPELMTVAQGGIFEDDAIAAATAYNVAFARDALTSEQQNHVSGFRTEIDDFGCKGREIFWLCRTRQSDSGFSSPALEKRLGTSVTWRGMNTVRRLVDKYAETKKGGRQ